MFNENMSSNSRFTIAALEFLSYFKTTNKCRLPDVFVEKLTFILCVGAF